LVEHTTGGARRTARPDRAWSALGVWARSSLEAAKRGVRDAGLEVRQIECRFVHNRQEQRAHPGAATHGVPTNLADVLRSSVTAPDRRCARRFPNWRLAIPAALSRTTQCTSPAQCRRNDRARLIERCQRGPIGGLPSIASGYQSLLLHPDSDTIPERVTHSELSGQSLGRMAPRAR
jgi:hypothetical protein